MPSNSCGAVASMIALASLVGLYICPHVSVACSVCCPSRHHHHHHHPDAQQLHRHRNETNGRIKRVRLAGSGQFARCAHQQPPDRTRHPLCSTNNLTAPSPIPTHTPCISERVEHN
jgi:hypothetical protein